MTYLMLALLMGGGLVLFGVGGDVSGGLVDAFKGGGGPSGNSALNDQIDKQEERLQANPRNEVVLQALVRNYYAKASRQTGVTGENLLRLLESRFDNVLVRLGFAGSRRQARQMIRHGHWYINGRRVDIPSYQLKPDDVITMKPSAPVEPVVRDATELTSAVPAWLQADHDGLTAKVLRLPERAEITTPVQEQLIVELYSK